MKKYNFKKEHIEKLYKGGLISEKTAKAHGYADGGIVEQLTAAQPPMMSANPDFVAPVSDVAPVPQAAPGPTDPEWVSAWNKGTPELGFAEKLRSAMGDGGISQLMNGNSQAPRAQSQKESAMRSQMLSGRAPEMREDEAVGTTGPMQKAGFAQEGGPVALAGNGPGQQHDQVEMPKFDSGIKSGYDAGAAAAAGQIGYNKTLQAEANQIQKNLDDDNKKAQTVFDQAQSYAQQALAANPDPNQIRQKFWDDKSTGQKMLAGVGLILGAFSPDGVNKAVGIIEKQIDQNIKAQELKSERLGKMADQSSTLYNQLRQKGMDKFQASIAMKDLMFKDVKLQIEKQEANAKSAAAKSNAVEANLKLQEMMQKNHKMLTEQYATERVNSPGVSKAEKSKWVNNLPAEQRALYVDGAGAFARSAADASKIREQDQAFNSSVALITRLESMGGKQIPYSERKAQSGTVTELLRAALRVPVLGPGTVNEAERARLEDIARDPSVLFQANAGAKMAELKRSLMTMQRAQYQAYGLPVQEDPDQLAASLGTRKR